MVAETSRPLLGLQLKVYTVSELTAELREVVGQTFPAVWVVGEISNLSRPRSGHVYLTLKDEEAQLSAVLWRSIASSLKFELRDGLEVICFGYLDIYPPQGKYELVIYHIEPRGIGTWELAFRQLYERLAKEGLFDRERKRPLPRFVRRVVLVTSPVGAAIHDFLQILARRWPGGFVLVVPTRVQGEGAATEIAAAIRLANQVARGYDCLVLARGGGSAEDLWAFNEEEVVRAVASSELPVVSAIGHEVDLTLCDLVADVRALTPSEAAERISVDRTELVAQLGQVARRMQAAIRERLRQARLRWQLATRSPVFRRPKDWIYERSRYVDEMALRIQRAMGLVLERSKSRLAQLGARLESLSPLAVLARGYSLTYLLPQRTILRDAAEAKMGSLLETHLERGSVLSRVEAVIDERS
ncbi:MAG: exodeoxyribonuclease VII large subunit [Thermoguttaceae bacterium]|nr:exodeoxyribonuclease VII large subunit [Thermoguttaceae bacterium]MDW8078612.1 exodeoxyribonuclease VII large subunit [Thermoguttaceae bacterium]